MSPPSTPKRGSQKESSVSRMRKLERLLSRMGLDATARAEVLALVKEKMPVTEQGASSERKAKSPRKAVVLSPAEVVAVVGAADGEGAAAPQLTLSQEVKRPTPPPRPARNATSQPIPKVVPPTVEMERLSISSKYAKPEYTLISPRGNDDVMEDLLQLVKSLYRSETEYIQNLDKVIKVYLEPIRESSKMKPEHVLLVFSNIEIIALVHKGFHVQLRTIVDLWPKGDTIGSALENVVGSLSIYSQYVNNFIVAIDFLEAETARSRALAAFLEEVEQTEPMSLHALLSVPLNRIPQYRAMADAMLDVVPRNTGQYQSLSGALLALSRLQEMLSDSLNESKYEREVAAVGESIVGWEGPPLLEKGRRFVMEGELVQKGLQDHRELHKVFLFNDLMVCTRTKDAKGLYRYKARFPLQYAMLSGGEGDMVMILVQPCTGEQWTLLAGDVEDKRKWMKAIRRCLNGMQATELFGVSLRRLMSREASGTLVPSLVTCLLQQIEKSPATHDVFSADSKVDTMKQRSLLDRGIGLDCAKFSTEECACLLLDFLALLKDPIIPFELYDAFLAIMEEESQVQALTQLIFSIPEHNQHLLKAVVRTLHNMAQRASSGGTTVTGLANAIVPYLIRKRTLQTPDIPASVAATAKKAAPLVQLMILHFQEVFPADPPRKFARANPVSARMSPHHAKSSTVSGSLVLGGRRIAPSSP